MKLNFTSKDTVVPIQYTHIHYADNMVQRGGGKPEGKNQGGGKKMKRNKEKIWGQYSIIRYNIQGTI